ncbi:MAG TPA: DsbA family oxidoreductase [Solirubrobacteraceae bacterium]|nr:DsbA family oxidoreductase [Solirubrobacteraceae bacterium]
MRSVNKEAAVDVEIWSDIACPWCYIGKRRFETALSRFEHRDEATVVWRSFELDPEAPAERTGDRAEHLARKYGMSLEQARAAEAQITETAAGDGLEFRFDIARGGNTFDGHRILHLARAHDLQDAMKERLLRAYFSEGELISDPETLVRLATEVGLPRDEAAQALADGSYADEVRDDERTASALGISAVPTFVIDRALGASGAHPPEALLELLNEGWARRPAAGVLADGESCSVDGC